MIFTDSSALRWRQARNSIFG